MLLLASTSDKLRLTTGSALTTAVHASYVDAASGTITPGRQNTAISTATTTDIVSAPGASTYRAIKAVSIRNTSTSANVLTAIHTDGTTACELISVSVPAGGSLHYDSARGWLVHGPAGRLYVAHDVAGPGVDDSVTCVILSADQAATTGASTYESLTELTFTYDANDTYWFRASVPYTSAATTTGSAWSFFTSQALAGAWVHSRYTLAATTQTVNYAATAGVPSTASASSLTAGNVAIVEAVFVAGGTGGTFYLRFMTEVTSSAITAKKGATLCYRKLIDV